MYVVEIPRAPLPPLVNRIRRHHTRIERNDNQHEPHKTDEVTAHTTEPAPPPAVRVLNLHRNSNSNGLAVFAPDVAEAVADFADRGERFDAGEYARKYVLVAARGVFKEREGDFGAL